MKPTGIICLNKTLRLIRLFHDLKQKELASRLGISTSHLSEIESAKKTPTIDLLNRYAQVFEVPVSSIVFLAENLDSSMALDKSQLSVSPKITAMLDFIASR